MYMLSQDEWTKHGGENVAENKFNGMGVNGSERDCDAMLMVDLVDIRVDLLLMQKSVAHMESEIFDHHAEQHLQQESDSIWDAIDGSDLIYEIHSSQGNGAFS